MIFLIYGSILALIMGILITGCSDDESYYQGDKQTNIQDENIYEVKLTITFNNDSTEVFHGSNVRISNGNIYVDDCKEVNNNKLLIEYYNVKYYYREDIVK